MSEQYLLLKWGSLKGWGGAVEGTAFHDALKRYHDDSVSLSAMTQKDTEGQKQAVVDLIDACEGEIVNDWSGERMTKEAAKKYVMEYRR
jgi:hypothetical protein